MAEPIIILLLLGLTIGSFLNACAYRIPRNISIHSPLSALYLTTGSLQSQGIDIPKSFFYI